MLTEDKHITAYYIKRNLIKNEHEQKNWWWNNKSSVEWNIIVNVEQQLIETKLPDYNESLVICEKSIT